MRAPFPSLLRGRSFHCREWALEKLQRCLEMRDRGAAGGRSAAVGVLVTGGPGAGKSALLTELAWPQSDVGRGTGLAERCLAWHFCQREDEGSLAAWRFVLAMAEQMRASPLLAPGYGHALDGPGIAPMLEPLQCQRDPDNTFKRAVLEPLCELPAPGRAVYLLVDSLDSGCGGGVGEGVGAGPMTAPSTSIAELLSRHLHLLPPWLLLVCSSRRQNKAVCKMFSGFRRLCLDDLRKPLVVRDVQQYILRRLDHEGTLRRQLTPETADMLNLLHIKSGGCFLFLQRVLDGVSRSLVGLREIRDIPGTLNGLYLWLCQRLFPRRLFLYVRPLLNALLASPVPLTPEELYAAAWTRDTGLGPGDFGTQLGALASLLVDGPGGTRLLFHGSFAEWLTDVKYCTQKFLCCKREGHLSLAMALSLRAPSLTTEETCRLAGHLLRSGLHADQPALLPLWLLWIGVPSLDTGTKAGSGGIDRGVSSPPPTPPCRTPVLIGQNMLQLLMKSGVYPPTCSPENGPSMGVNCVSGRGGGIVRRALEREDSVRSLLDSGVNANRTDPSDGRTLLATVAHAGSVDVAALLLCRGADPLLSDHQGQTPLTLAARQGHTAVIQVLLEWVAEQGASEASAPAAGMLEQADSEGWTALRSAAWGGHAEAVRLLLGAGAEVDGCDLEGRTALRAAAWGGHEEILLTLLDHGAQVDHADREGRTPLHAAAFMGHREALEILLDAGAEVDLPDGDGRTALSVAALCVPSGNRGYGEVVSLLLERGSDPGHHDGDGMTPLLLAAHEGHEEVAELLLEAGADVDEGAGPRVAAVTPLLAAAAAGHAGTVSRVLFWGATVDGIDGEGRTALSLAAARGSVEVVRALLDRGLDENHRDDLGWTPLHAAACEGQRAVCAALTERGSMARVGELDIEGRTPLILAAQEGHCSTARLLLDRRAPIDHRAYDGHSALSAAMLQGHGEVAELLMRRGSDTDVRDAEGRPLLYLLVLERRLDMVALLLEKGGVPLESRDQEGRTALHAATWHGDLAALRLLLGRGADPNARDAEGRPPLHSAAWRGLAEAGRLLLDARGTNADLACQAQGATALCIAAQEGHGDMVAALLEAGADPEHTDRYGRSPVTVAGRRGHNSIVRLLESHGARPYPGPLPPPSPRREPTVPPTSVSSGSAGAEPPAASPSPPSSSASPASTAGRFGSIPGSQTSSSCHSQATVQTVPADSLSFTALIQQHSLPRCRSRPGTLPRPGSTSGSVHRSRAAGKASPPHAHCTPSGLAGGGDAPLKVLSSPGGSDCLLMPKSPHLMGGGDLARSPHPCGGGGGGGGGRWNSVMASLGVMPGQEGLSRPPKSRDSPPLGYPPLQLQPPTQTEEWEDFHKMSLTCNLSATSPSSALADETVVSMTTTDPRLNLKQQIKLQFEGPTSAALYKRETPL